MLDIHGDYVGINLILQAFGWNGLLYVGAAGRKGDSADRTMYDGLQRSIASYVDVDWMEQGLAQAVSVGSIYFIMGTIAFRTNPSMPLHITTKAPDAYSALGGVINRLEHDAVVVLLCNGMGAYEELISDERFRNISYMLGVTTNGVYTTERFNCVHTGLGDTWVGKPMDSRISPADACSTTGSLQQLSGLPVKLDEHINRTLWEKLAVNASINGITAIINCRNGEIMNNPHGMSLVTNLCSEVGQVMEASGVPPSTGLLSSVLGVMQKTAMNFSSMHQDIMLGRPTEIDYINGFVVKKGLLLGVPTPTNLAIVDLIKMKERLQS